MTDETTTGDDLVETVARMQKQIDDLIVTAEKTQHQLDNLTKMLLLHQRFVEEIFRAGQRLSDVGH